MNVELKFEKIKSNLSQNHYNVFYRPKNFVPQEIIPKTIFEKIKRFFVGKKFTENEWKQLFYWDYKHPKYESHIHPDFWYSEFKIHKSEIDKFIKKFDNLEAIEKWQNEDKESYNKALKEFESKIIIVI